MLGVVKLAQLSRPFGDHRVRGNSLFGRRFQKDGQFPDQSGYLSRSCLRETGICSGTPRARHRQAGRREIEAAGGQAIIVPVDVAVNEQVEAAAAALVEQLVLIDPSGSTSHGCSLFPAMEMTPEEFRRVDRRDTSLADVGRPCRCGCHSGWNRAESSAKVDDEDG